MRLLTIFFVLSVVLFFPALVSAQDKRLRVNQDKAFPPFESVTDSAQAELIIPISILVEQLNLKLFDAANAELSVCLGEAPCLYFAQQIKAWRCVSNVCEQGEEGMRPAACFADQFRSYSDEDQTKISQAICSIVKSPTKETRISLLDLVPDMSEHVLIENSAYLWAFKKNVDQCVAVIKDYVGEFGPNWNFRWYRSLSGCRILAQESTRVKEEKDYHKWLSIQRGEGQCSDIKNKTLREACEAPGSAYPKPGFEFLPGISNMDVVATQGWIDSLELNVFGALKEDLSLCKDNELCLEKVNDLQDWFCFSKACSGKEPIKEMGNCNKEFFDNSSREFVQKFNELACAYLNTPNSQTRKDLSQIESMEDPDIDGLLKAVAVISALNGSAKSCQETIKNHVGQYGPLWSREWYAALSGCRILAGESTLEQEEKDFRRWLAVESGMGSCSHISNPELREACTTPGATFPKFVYEKK